MVIVIIRYVDDYSNNSLKMDTQFLINFPMQHLGFTDIGSSFSLYRHSFLQGFAGSIEFFSAIPSFNIPAIFNKIAKTLKIFL